MRLRFVYNRVKGRFVCARPGRPGFLIIIVIVITIVVVIIVYGVNYTRCNEFTNIMLQGYDKNEDHVLADNARDRRHASRHVGRCDGSERDSA